MVIGLAVKKEVILGIVYNPILEQLFTARKGRGAFLNGKPIQVSKVQGKRILISPRFSIRQDMRNANESEEWRMYKMNAYTRYIFFRNNKRSFS